MGNLTIEIRDRRIPGGRLSISAGTDSPTERDRRKESVRALLDLGETGLRVLELLRERKLKVADVDRSVRSLNVGALLHEAEQAEEPKAPEGPPPILLGATIDAFLRRVQARLSERTLDIYREACAQMEEAFGVRRSGVRIAEDVEIASITTAQAEAWLHGPKLTAGGKPWAPRTQRTKHAVALQVWQTAIDLDEERSDRLGIPRTVTRNLWGRKKVRPPRARKTRVVFLQRAEAGKLLRAVRGRRYALWVALGLYAGLRAAEAAHLRPGVDVDLEDGWLHVQSRGGKHAWTTKTDNATRDVPICRPLARWIRAHMRHGFSGERFLVHPEGEDCPLGRTTRTDWTRTAFRAAGIEYGRRGDALTYHSLRHTFASWLVRQDVQLKKVAALLGDTTQVVDATYSHLLPSDLRPVVEKLTAK